MWNSGKTQRRSANLFWTDRAPGKVNVLECEYCRKDTLCGVAKSLSQWMSKTVGIQLNNLAFAFVACEEMTQATAVPGVSLLVLMAVKERTTDCCMEVWG